MEVQEGDVQDQGRFPAIGLIQLLKFFHAPFQPEPVYPGLPVGKHRLKEPRVS